MLCKLMLVIEGKLRSRLWLEWGRVIALVRQNMWIASKGMSVYLIMGYMKNNCFYGFMFTFSPVLVNRGKYFRVAREDI